MALSNNTIKNKLLTANEVTDKPTYNVPQPTKTKGTKAVIGEGTYTVKDKNGNIISSTTGYVPKNTTPVTTKSNTTNSPTKDWTAYGTQNVGDLMNDVYNNFDYSTRDNTNKAIQQYMDLFDYDENSLRRKFNAATMAEYAAKRAANQEAQAAYGRDVATAGNTLSDTLSKTLSNAVAKGYSRGALAAQQQAAMLGLQETTAADATKLAQERQQLAYDEATAIAKNAEEAEALAQSRIAQLASNALNQYTADSAVEQSLYYGGASGTANAYGTSKAAQASYHDTDVDAQTANNEVRANVLNTLFNSPAGTLDVGVTNAILKSLGMTDKEANDWLISRDASQLNTTYSHNNNNNYSYSDYGSYGSYGGSSGSYGGSSYYSGGSNGSSSNSNNANTYAQALTENGAWTKTQADYIINNSPKTNASAYQSILEAKGATPTQARNIMKAVNEGSAVFRIEKASGSLVLSVNKNKYTSKEAKEKFGGCVPVIIQNDKLNAQLFSKPKSKTTTTTSKKSTTTKPNTTNTKKSNTINNIVSKMNLHI